jgi:peptide/nickel transport system substrate-binding protein
MRSIRRIDRFGPLVAATLGAAVIAYVAFLAPPEPQAPRYAGAGSEEPRHGGTFVMHHETAIRTLDPAIAYDEVSGLAIRLIFDGLLDYDRESNLIPSLAEALPTRSEDGKTFVFRLRRGVLFHDGGTLTADDVLFTMERMLDPDTGAPGYVFYTNLEGVDAYRAGEAEHISGIRVLDAHTIEFTLKEPDQTFLNAMAMTFAYPIPRSHYESPTVDVRIAPIGTGPFTMVADDWERGVQMVLERNERYWNAPLPYPDRIVYLENLHRDVATMRFRNGDLDAVHRLSPADYIFLSNSADWAPYQLQYPKNNVWGIGMNTQMPPFDDVHVRLAVAHAVDANAWNRQRSGRLMPTGQPLPPGFLGYDPNLPGAHHHDLERARREMALAGHRVERRGERWVAAGLENEVFEFWVGEGETGRQYGEMLQSDLAKIGLTVRIKQVAFPVYLEETGKPNRVRLFLVGWNMDFPDPSNFLDILFSSASIAEQNSNNRVFYSNREVDAILTAAKIEPDRGRRGQMYREAQRLIVADAPWAFMWNDRFMEVWQPYVHYRPHPVWTVDYRDLWLDLPKRRVAERYGVFRSPSQLAALFPFGGVN